jgi:anthranilate phosphoribosyltransferase
MRYVAPIRRELGVPTIFNYLGPLTNPSRTRHQLVGVNDPAMASVMATVLGATGSRRAMIIYADDGLDELSVTSASTVLELNGDGDGTYELSEWRVDPASLGLAPATMQDLRGGDAAFNAAAIRSVLAGAPGANRDIGVLNAAAALMVIGRVGDLAAGLELAYESIDSGRAATALEKLVATSQAAWAESGD